MYQVKTLTLLRFAQHNLNFNYVKKTLILTWNIDE
jgi:hypothetical protein